MKSYLNVAVKTEAIVTSSSILDTSFFPHYARLRNENGKWAWIPATTADHNSTWLQIDLGNVSNLSAVASQGSCSGDQWTKSYVIMYRKLARTGKRMEIWVPRSVLRKLFGRIKSTC